jgi:hypothetical protein
LGDTGLLVGGVSTCSGAWVGGSPTLTAAIDERRVSAEVLSSMLRQKRHFTAMNLIVSPQKGHVFVSSAAIFHLVA